MFRSLTSVSAVYRVKGIRERDGIVDLPFFFCSYFLALEIKSL
jgi:hypothetical protein